MKFEIQTGHFRGTREGYLKNTRIEKKEAPMKKSAALILPAVGGVLSPVWQKGVTSSRIDERCAESCLAEIDGQVEFHNFI